MPSKRLQSTGERPRPISTRIVEDEVFSDILEMEKPRLIDYDRYAQVPWEGNPELRRLLRQRATSETEQDALYTYFERAERELFALDSQLHILEKGTLRDCIRLFKSIIGSINEKRTAVRALDSLGKLAKGKQSGPDWEVSVGFILEFINLFPGVQGTDLGLTSP